MEEMPETGDEVCVQPAHIGYGPVSHAQHEIMSGEYTFEAFVEDTTPTTAGLLTQNEDAWDHDAERVVVPDEALYLLSGNPVSREDLTAELPGRALGVLWASLPITVGSFAAFAETGETRYVTLGMTSAIATGTGAEYLVRYGNEKRELDELGYHAEQHVEDRGHYTVEPVSMEAYADYPRYGLTDDEWQAVREEASPENYQAGQRGFDPIYADAN